MALLKIYEYGAPVLRKIAEPVDEVTEELAVLAENMLHTMYEAPGIGLAAPQVGESVRLIVVDVSGPKEDNEPFVIFNPEITPESEAELSEEGCLSVPGIYAEVKRPSVITVKGLDIDGDPIELNKIDGLFARCILHEVDHLDGILFVDHLSDVDKIEYEKQLNKMAKANS